MRAWHKKYTRHLVQVFTIRYAIASNKQISFSAIEIIKTMCVATVPARATETIAQVPIAQRIHYACVGNMPRFILAPLSFFA